MKTSFIFVEIDIIKINLDMESKPAEIKCRFIFYVPTVKYEQNDED